MAKPTGLAQFAKKQSAPAASTAPAEISAPADASAPAERTRGKGPTVALTVRLSRADWSRLHEVARDEGVSLQQLAMRGFSRVLKEKGLKGLTP